MNIVYIENTENFQKEVLDSKIPVLVDFYADWCGPCKMISPMLEQISTEYLGKLKVCKVNVDHSQQLAMENQVVSIPAVKFFKQGVKVDEFNGALPKSSIEDYIKKHI